jgi:hypothetical protein
VFLNTATKQKNLVGVGIKHRGSQRVHGGDALSVAEGFTEEDVIYRLIFYE